jgi:integrase
MTNTRTTYREPKFYLDGQKIDSKDLKNLQQKTGINLPEKKYPILLKYTFARGKRIAYQTGERIEATKWNDDLQRVKKNVLNAADINDALDAIAAAAKSAEREARQTGAVLTKEELKNRLDIVTGRQTAKTTFFEIYDHFTATESKMKSWTKGTHTKLSTIRRQLVAFEEWQRKIKKSYSIDLREVNEDFFTELIEFWQTEYDLRNSTIQKNIHILRWFFNWCLKKNLMPASFKGVKVDLKQTKKKIIFLDLAELKQIKNCEIPSQQKYLDRTRDIFIFQCFTGLRYSDLKNLKASDIKNGCLEISSTIKTQERVSIELNATTSDILNKYSEYQAATGYALPVPVNQDYNKFLKKLAKLAGLNEKIILVHYAGDQRIEQTFEKWQLISSHSARRSFITNGLALGIGSEVLRSWTGHKSEESFRAYYEIVKAKKQADMNKFKL